MLEGSVRRPDGARLRFQLDGDRGNPVLLLLQGQTNSHRWWRRLRGDFGDRFLTVTFDYRGSGATAVPEPGSAQDVEWSVELFADDAAAVLRALGRTRAAVYGTSMGGRIAQHLAIRHPDLVDRLVLACTTAGGELATPRSVEVQRSLVEQDKVARRRAVFDLFYRPTWIAAQGGYDHAPTDLLGDPTMPTWAARRHFLVSAKHSSGAYLADISAPVLVLHGTDDRFTPVIDAEVLADRLPRARLEVVTGGRHGFFDEFRDTVVPLVRDHLTAS